MLLAAKKHPKHLNKKNYQIVATEEVRKHSTITVEIFIAYWSTKYYLIMFMSSEILNLRFQLIDPTSIFIYLQSNI